MARRIQAVIFDFDDTLVDWSRQEVGNGRIYRRHVDNVHAYLTARGILLPDTDAFFKAYLTVLIAAWQEAKKTWAGVSFVDTWLATLARFDVDVAGLDLDAVWRAFDWRPVPAVRPYPDALPTLQTLRQTGYKIGLVTNSMMPMWMRDIELRAYGMLSYLDVRVTSGDVGVMKPHPDIYHAVLQPMQLTPEQALFVGDRPANDIAGANEVGMTSVLMAPPHLDYDVGDAQPDYTITSLSELLPILGTLS